MPTSLLASLSGFELPKEAVVPMLKAFRLTNTMLDAAFYDTAILYGALLERGSVIVAQAQNSTADISARAALNKLDLSALANPEDAILVVDPRRPPFISQPYHTVEAFLRDSAGVQTLSLTGVGSSALGSAAFAWNISEALSKPVAAIVPGYGLADVVHQALGGWFGFGLHDWIRRETQEILAATAPELAKLGRNLLAADPDRPRNADTGAPLFRQGSVGSDTLHAILRGSSGITQVVGHSKGALSIANAIRSLPASTTQPLSVVTFGCTIAPEIKVARYDQHLGWIDGLGILNSWKNKPNHWLFSHHSTNTLVPLSMAVKTLMPPSA
ncbi:hypothetical protein [Methylobacterium sp. ID0610]|uniref:hypothetical protein n=1 Tax=Methylobacterium carpenticola TaxID=3344827 RepID=UPI0036C8F8B9